MIDAGRAKAVGRSTCILILCLAAASRPAPAVDYASIRQAAELPIRTEADPQAGIYTYAQAVDDRVAAIIAAIDGIQDPNYDIMMTSIVISFMEFQDEPACAISFVLALGDVTLHTDAATEDRDFQQFFLKGTEWFAAADPVSDRLLAGAPPSAASQVEERYDARLWADVARCAAEHPEVAEIAAVVLPRMVKAGRLEQADLSAMPQIQTTGEDLEATARTAYPSWDRRLRFRLRREPWTEGVTSFLVECGIQELSGAGDPASSALAVLVERASAGSLGLSAEQTWALVEASPGAPPPLAPAVPWILLAAPDGERDAALAAVAPAAIAQTLLLAGGDPQSDAIDHALAGVLGLVPLAMADGLQLEASSRDALVEGLTAGRFGRDAWGIQSAAAAASLAQRTARGGRGAAPWQREVVRVAIERPENAVLPLEGAYAVAFLVPLIREDATIDLGEAETARAALHRLILRPRPPTPVDLEHLRSEPHWLLRALAQLGSTTGSVVTPELREVVAEVIDGLDARSRRRLAAEVAHAQAFVLGDTAAAARSLRLADGVEGGYFFAGLPVVWRLFLDVPELAGERDAYLAVLDEHRDSWSAFLRYWYDLCAGEADTPFPEDSFRSLATYPDLAGAAGVLPLAGERAGPLLDRLRDPLLLRGRHDGGREAPTDHDGPLDPSRMPLPALLGALDRIGWSARR